MPLSHPAPHPTRTSLSLPPLGLGCVTFGREIDRTNAFALMDHALRHGLSHFDTAAAYGAGASEEIVGQWLIERGASSRITVATKILPPYSPASVSASITTSLARLRLRRVDVLYLHRWDGGVLQDETLRFLDTLVRNGRVGYLGASNFSAAQLEQAIERQQQLGLASFRVAQTIHNYAVRGVDDALTALCRREHITIVGYSPLGAGFLTGKHHHGVAPGSRFDLIPGHQDIYFNAVARQRLARAQAVAEKSGVPLTRLALAWALQHPAVTTVLVGGRTVSHLDQAVQAQSFSAPAILGELDAA